MFRELDKLRRGAPVRPYIYAARPYPDFLPTRRKGGPSATGGEMQTTPGCQRRCQRTAHHHSCHVDTGKRFPLRTCWSASRRASHSVPDRTADASLLIPLGSVLLEGSNPSASE
ncbi:hypothetical protein BH24ACT15_BH24ACT15_05470 [soil metagenome]